jgi:hypothetical protein
MDCWIGRTARLFPTRVFVFTIHRGRLGRGGSTNPTLHHSTTPSPFNYRFFGCQKARPKNNVPQVFSPRMKPML